MQDYYGIQRQLGSAVMTLAVVTAYLAGFEKIVGIVSSIGPVIILFALLVGALTVGKDFGNFSDIGQYQVTLAQASPSPNWLLSAFSYSSLCLFTAGTYFTALGQSAVSRREAKAGATIGSLSFLLVLAMMNTAILLNGGEITRQEIPTLYLAARISPLLSGLFSGVLLLGMFATCSTMMWSAASRFFKQEAAKNRRFAIALGIIVLISGQVPFSRLLGIFYPLVGYAGLVYLGCVLWRRLAGIRPASAEDTGERSKEVNGVPEDDPLFKEA